MAAMEDHELRQTLNDELHGRPGLPVLAPARITHLAFTLTETDPDPLSFVKVLCDALGVKSPPGQVHHHAVILDKGLVKYERHGEFYRISITANETVKGRAHDTEAISNLPLGWVDNLPGKRLVAIHTQVLSKSTQSPTDVLLRKIFGHDEIACSYVNQKNASVWTDFRIGADGFTRMLVHDHGLSPMRMGRLTRRLHEIETYRMMALLAFPLARQLQKELGPLEKALSQTIASMVATQSANEDETLLQSLSGVTRDVEDISNRSSFRFAASRAYAALVAKRITELGEERVLNHQRLGVFLDRRFSPAMTTCTAVAERIASLAARGERASNLLRTRVDIALEGQNQKLLRSMETRARQQLMLQETVEGLSVVAISYYLISIVTKLIDGLAGYMGGFDSKLIDLLAIPVVLVAVWLAVRRVRKRLRSEP